MKYKRADELIPMELLAILQEYVDGDYLYIPRKPQHKIKWGEKNGYKKQLNDRNREILSKFYEGYTVKQLALAYYLSEKSIYRIIANSKLK